MSHFRRSSSRVSFIVRRNNRMPMSVPWQVNLKAIYDFDVRTLDYEFDYMLKRSYRDDFWHPLAIEQVRFSFHDVRSNIYSFGKSRIRLTGQVNMAMCY